MAQTSLSEAKAANREFQERGQHKRKMLRPAINDVDDLWSPKVQQVLESNALMRSVMVDFLSTDDLAMARTLHMEIHGGIPPLPPSSPQWTGHPGARSST